MPEPTTARMANAIRFLAIDAIVRAGEGHQGVPLGLAEIATALYTRHLKFDAADPAWPDRDRVVLSNGHGSMLLYALLHLTGHERMGIEQVATFRDFGSRCEGHPEREACDFLVMGKARDTGRYGPTWYYEDKLCAAGPDTPGCTNHESNQFLVIAKGPGRYEACAADTVPMVEDGERCGVCQIKGDSTVECNK